MHVCIDTSGNDMLSAEIIDLQRVILLYLIYIEVVIFLLRIEDLGDLSFVYEDGACCDFLRSHDCSVLKK